MDLSFDAREIGDKLPIKKLGPWDFRSREEALKSARRENALSLWKPARPWTGDRPVTREELAEHTTFDDCRVVIRGKVHDLPEWKDHHPGGPFVARLFGGQDLTVPLTLARSEAFGTGVVQLVYRPAGGA